VPTNVTQNLFIRMTCNLNYSCNYPLFKQYCDVVAVTVSQCPLDDGRVTRSCGLNNNEICTYSTFMLVLGCVSIRAFSTESGAGGNWGVPSHL
jgi:hypothetical protein